MRLNEPNPAAASRSDANRVGRGSASGNGKTAGRGHKGQKARSGGFHKVGFEGGQMPLQRRVPKVGFRSRSGRWAAEVRLSELKYVDGDTVAPLTLKQADVIGHHVRTAKIIASGAIERAVTVRGGVGVTRGARAAIEKAGGKIEG